MGGVWNKTFDILVLKARFHWSYFISRYRPISFQERRGAETAIIPTLGFGFVEGVADYEDRLPVQHNIMI